MTSNCPTFFLKKLQKMVTIWEHLPKRYYFWSIIKQKRQKVLQFEVMDCIESIIFCPSIMRYFPNFCKIEIFQCIFDSFIRWKKVHILMLFESRDSTYIVQPLAGRCGDVNGREGWKSIGAKMGQSNRIWLIWRIR